MSQAAFALLHEGVQRAIYDLGWKQIRPVQTEAIHALLEGEGHVLISAATAGGKTEAAFLPVISRLAAGEQDSIRAIYVGPLKALINDQFGRLDRLCERMHIPVHRWHGDVTASHKQALRRDPSGILLITPESLESNFINYGNQVPRLYRGLEFVVIDELHSFLGNVRGVHLLSLLSRLRAATGRQPRMIGLSATLGDPEMGKCFLAPDAPATVTHIQDAATGRSIRFALKGVLKTPDPAKGGSGARRLTPASAREFIQKKSAEQLLAAGESPRTESKPAKADSEPALPDDLDDIAEDLVRHLATSTNLVFVNSRRTAEELAVRLHDRVTKLKWPHDPFMIHHGSVAKELREETETALKSGLPTTAICSSTLEMGIDIGSVRSVGQIDPPWSVASLVQRLGRSGRREGESSIMRLYVREESPHAGSRLTDLLFPDLLRGIALTRLMREKWLEPAEQQRMHLSTLVHQILSWLRQTGGMPAARLHAALVVAGPFRKIGPADFAGLLRGLAAHQLIEQVPTGDLILAPAGERITAAKDFYSAFKGTEMFSVRHEKNEIGELAFDAVPPVGQLVILAGRRWLVGEIDAGAKTVWVTPSHGGKAPVFVGSGGELHPRIVQEMKAVLLGDDEPSFLDEPALELLRTARHVAHTVGLDKTDVLPAPGGVRWFPWAGTRCLRTLALLAKANKVNAETDRLSLWLSVEGMGGFRDFLKLLTATKYDPIALGHLVTPRAVEKFDEFIPDELLDQAAAIERLAVAEAIAAIEGARQRLS
ncbi:MAG: ATP-dependent helicase Lhr and Lhr-like helicase [Limisphaerales bacterium]|nr:MAG: ATP-dependent helicase Lhr and Lhr-like helicase [Limisphaerales bacterium]TXT49487.1 MAG: ATP-dependent helicase Lhr and Lhr-like helicase [Limisphaerales bacterium]